jgi:hypothetical protein
MSLLKSRLVVRLPDNLGFGLICDLALAVMVLQDERAELMAIISECILNGDMLTICPLPQASKGVKVAWDCGRGLVIISTSIGHDDLGNRPVFSAPPS